MYKPLPKQLTIKKSPIEGLGLYATEDIKKNSYLGVTHIRDEQFENKYIRTPVGGFYNHSNDPNVIRMVSDTLPKLKFGEIVDPKKNIREEKDKKTSLDDVFYHLQEKSDAKYMFLISIKDIKAGEELTANYNPVSYTHLTLPTKA